jgi:hypothetical protein
MNIYRDKKVVGVFVRFYRAASGFLLMKWVAIYAARFG